MAPSIAQQSLPTPLLVQEKRAKTAKADLRKTGDEAFYARIGQCIDEVRNVFGLSIKEFAAVLGKNESQVRRWVEGSERPQIEAVFAVEKFQGAMVIALARLATGVDVDTVIHVRRSA
jgi:ribosome-binding protein aMBF1 (putative translation factor)